MSRRYKFYNPEGAYFVSFATVNWIDVFIKDIYLNILANSITYCREAKGMECFAYCLMPNHVHLIFRDENGNPSGLLRDYKKFTAKAVLKAIAGNSREAKKEKLLSIFKKAGENNPQVSKYQFWQHNNLPIELWSTAFIKQKLLYIHQNPVEAGLVTETTEWKYSSARNYAEMDAMIEVDDIGFLR